MAVTATPVFGQALKTGQANVATADTALVNPVTGQATVFTAGANGSKVFEITVQQAQSGGVASMVRIFIGASATTGKLVDEFVKTSVTGSNTAAMFRLTRQYDNLLVAANQLVIATVAATDNVNVIAWYADY